MAKKGVLTKSDYLPYEEFLSTLEKLREDRLYWEELYFTIAFASALRVSDIRMLKWDNVLNKNSIILIEKKTKKNREVRLNDEAVGIIKELYTLMGKPSINSCLFEGYKNKPMGIWQINKRLKDVKDRYNLSIDHFSTHSFRKTFGRYLYEANGRSQESLMMLKEVLNHSNVGTTYTYIGIRTDEINKFINGLQLRRHA